MTRRPEARRYGRVFNEVAEEYDRHRPAYPDALIHRACETAGLTSGVTVLEIGSGTGQLTRSLLARGLRVVAVEPGEQLITQARKQLSGAGDLQFVNTPFEEAPVPCARYRAVFSATAVHWIDPDVGWRKIADALTDDGTLALLSYFGLQDPDSDADQQALRASITGIAPDLGAESPPQRALAAMVEGAAQRRGNVSEAWAWLGGYDVAREYVSGLFEDAELAVMPMHVEQTADALNALLATMSIWARLSPGQREALVAENRALYERLGRPIRSSIAACLLTARRTAR